MIVNDDDLFTLAESVWTSTLGLELKRASEGTEQISGTVLTACVQIAGDWQGAVTVSCAASLASSLTSAMFMLDESELGADEIRDAMGEIANMTGGNVKGLAPGNNTLALPTVVEGADGAMSIARTQRLNEVVAYSNGQPIVFSVYERSEA